MCNMINQANFSRTTTAYPTYDDMLANPEYYERTKKLVFEIQDMTPDEYLEKAKTIWSGQGEKVDSVWRDQDKVVKYKKLLKDGTEFPMPILDFARNTQEGRHRALAAKAAGISTIPVLVVWNKVEEQPIKKAENQELKDRSWTLEEATALVQRIAPIAAANGYTKPEIIGSVKTKGYSDHDLDLHMSVTPEAEAANNYDFESFIMQLADADILYYGESNDEEGVNEFADPKGRIVDIFFGADWLAIHGAKKDTTKRYWIDPQGKVHSLNGLTHGGWALDNVPMGFDDVYDEEDEWPEYVLDSAVDSLMQQGWVRTDKEGSGLFMEFGTTNILPPVMNVAKSLLSDTIKEGGSVVIEGAFGDFEANNKIELGQVFMELGSQIETQAAKSLPTIFLGGSCKDPKNEWRKTVKDTFKDHATFVDPYDPEWVAEDNIYSELGDMLNSDFVVFYQGGEGTEKEIEFLDGLDLIEIPYKVSDKLPEIIKAIEEWLKTNPQTTLTLLEGDVVKKNGIPLTLEAPVLVSTHQNNLELITSALAYDYGCIEIPVPDQLRAYLLKDIVGERTSPDKLNQDVEWSVWGMETDSHITVLYGITDETPTDKVAETCTSYFTRPLSLKIGKQIKYFDNEDSSVAYVPVECQVLEDLHYALAEALPNADTHPKYIPHLTLCYLKPGGRLSSDSLDAFEWQANTIYISDAAGQLLPVLCKSAEDPSGLLTERVGA